MLFFHRQVMCLGVLAEEEGLVGAWPWWEVTGVGS